MATEAITTRASDVAVTATTTARTDMQATSATSDLVTTPAAPVATAVADAPAVEGDPHAPAPGTGTGDTTTPPAGDGGAGTPTTPEPVPAPEPTPAPEPEPTPVPAPEPAPVPEPDPAGSPPASGGNPGGDAGPAPTGPDLGPPPAAIDPTYLAPPPPLLPGLTLDGLTTIAAAALPTDQLVARSQATISQALQAGGAAGGGPAGASIVVRLLQTALQRDENGLTVYDAKELSLEHERRRIESELRRRGAAPDLVQRLMSNIIEQGMVKREREKVEGLLALMVSICFGNIPKGLVNRLVELGFGPEVERALRDAIGNGRHLSRGAIRDLMSLASSGLGVGGAAMPEVGAAPEHQTEAYYRDEDRRIARAASATGGARMLDPGDADAAELPSTLSDAIRARAVNTGWGSPASTT